MLDYLRSTFVPRPANWCPGRDLNPHSPCGEKDFKSFASADFATRAGRLSSFIIVNGSVNTDRTGVRLMRDYSSRREFIGSTREALRAGKNPATPATKASIAALTESVQGSLVFTP